LDVKDDTIKDYLSKKGLPTLDEVDDAYSRLQALDVAALDKNVKLALTEQPLRGLCLMEKLLFDPRTSDSSSAANAELINQISEESEDEQTRLKAAKVSLLVQRKVKLHD